MRETRVDFTLTTGAGRAPFLTYEPYYGLKEKAFSLSADPRFLFKSPTHGPVFDHLRAGIRRREGLIVLTGEPGTGKTTLCRSVLKALDRKTFCTIVPDPFLSREDLLKVLLIDFGVMSVEDLKSGRLNGASRPELSYPLYEFLKTLVPLQAYCVLIIDEAQNLSSQLLEEIRILADLEAPEKLLQLVLVGQPELRLKLKDSTMRQVDQRVSVRCTLEPLDRAAVSGYITHRLSIAGGTVDGVQFTHDALDLIHRVSSGNPRVINLLADKALYFGYLERAWIVTPPIVSDAVRELGLEKAVVAIETANVEFDFPAESTIGPAAPTSVDDEPPFSLEEAAVEALVVASPQPRWRRVASVMTIAAIVGAALVTIAIVMVERELNQQLRMATPPPAPIRRVPSGATPVVPITVLSGPQPHL